MTVVFLRLALVVLAFFVDVSLGLNTGKAFSVGQATASPAAAIHVVAAGDIACSPKEPPDAEDGPDACKQKRTAALVARQMPLDAVLPLGDEHYPAGALSDFRIGYDPTWGKFKAISRPVPGNHEYKTPHAAGYYAYFGAAAGDPKKGYYSYNLGTWHFVALNSNCAALPGGCAANSAQVRWLRADLAQHPHTCILAYWHHPRFSSAKHHSDASYTPFWKALYDAGAAIVLNGHDHDYERFAPQTPAGSADPVHGAREFVVGSGGRSHYPYTSIEPNSQVRNNTAYGILDLTLRPDGYAWKYLTAGGTVSDSGEGACRNAAVHASAS
jgi:hypothetical protein